MHHRGNTGPLLGCPRLARTRLNVTSAAFKSPLRLLLFLALNRFLNVARHQVRRQVRQPVRRLQLDKPVPHPGDVSTIPNLSGTRRNARLDQKFHEKDPQTVSGGKRHDTGREDVYTKILR